MASTKKIKVEYELSHKGKVNTGDLGQQRGDLHWNDYRWCVSEPSDSIQQGRGRKRTEQAVLQP